RFLPAPARSGKRPPGPAGALFRARDPGPPIHSTPVVMVRIRTTHPVPRAAPHDIARALRAASLALHRRSDAHFARHGVTADQFVLLAVLAGGGAAAQRQPARCPSSDPNTVRAMPLLLAKRGRRAPAPPPADRPARPGPPA